ncbi:MAG: hypothetical protein ACI9LY_003241 [Arenicella sp.]|jgi:hypothetical protein
MKFLKYSFISLLTLVLIGGAGYLLAASGMQSKPGYAKLTLPSWLSTNTTVALNLGPRGLKPVRWVINRVLDASNQELELSERILIGVLDDLQGVRLRIYEVENNSQVFEQAIDDSIASLKQKNWQTLLSVQEDDKHIVVMQAEDEGLISGLSVLLSTPENAFFMNLVGQLNPQSIALIAESFDPSDGTSLY